MANPQLQALERQELQGTNPRSRLAVREAEGREAGASPAPGHASSEGARGPAAPETALPFTIAFLFHLQNVPCVLSLSEK